MLFTKVCKEEDMRIRVSRSETKKVSNEMLEAADSFEQYLKNFISIIENINNIWQGQDAVKTINMMRDKYVPMMYKYLDMLERYAEYVGRVFGAYGMLDKIYTDKFKQIMKDAQANGMELPIEGGVV